MLDGADLEYFAIGYLYQGREDVAIGDVDEVSFDLHDRRNKSEVICGWIMFPVSTFSGKVWIKTTIFAQN